VLLEPSITGVRAEAGRLVRDVLRVVALAEKSFSGLPATDAVGTIDHQGDGRGGEAGARLVESGGAGQEEFRCLASD
jgi:hypothetical protein